MSFSRWSFSPWYTYENCDGKFVCVDHGEWAALDLKKNMDSILQKIREEKFHHRSRGPGSNWTEDEILELRGYMNDFLKYHEKELTGPWWKFKAAALWSRFLAGMFKE